MKETYSRLLLNSFKYSLLVISFVFFAVMFLYGKADRDVAAIEEYMEGTVFLNFLVTGTAKGTLFFMKVFLVIAAILAMTTNLFLHLLARLLQNGEPTVWKKQAGWACLILAFVMELLLFVVSILLSMGNFIIPIILAFIVIANLYSARRIWREGVAYGNDQSQGG